MIAVFERWREALVPEPPEKDPSVARMAFWLNRIEDPVAEAEDAAFGFELRRAHELGLVELLN